MIRLGAALSIFFRLAIDSSLDFLTVYPITFRIWQLNRIGNNRGWDFCIGLANT